MNPRSPLPICLAAVACVAAVQATPAGSPALVNHSASSPPAPQLLAGGFQGLAGSTIGPDGKLHITEPATGRILRVNPRTGSTTTLASGLPPSVIGLGGAMDVAFMGNPAYALVTLVGPDVGGTHVVGIYRVDRPNTFTVVADIGDFSIRNPPKTAFDVPSGLQYAMDVHDARDCWSMWRLAHCTRCTASRRASYLSAARRQGAAVIHLDEGARVRQCGRLRD